MSGKKNRPTFRIFRFLDTSTQTCICGLVKGILKHSFNTIVAIYKNLDQFKKGQIHAISKIAAFFMNVIAIT